MLKTVTVNSCYNFCCKNSTTTKAATPTNTKLYSIIYAQISMQQKPGKQLRKPQNLKVLKKFAENGPYWVYNANI